MLHDHRASWSEYEKVMGDWYIKEGNQLAEAFEEKPDVIIIGRDEMWWYTATRRVSAWVSRAIGDDKVEIVYVLTPNLRKAHLIKNHVKDAILPLFRYAEWKVDKENKELLLLSNGTKIHFLPLSAVCSGKVGTFDWGIVVCGSGENHLPELEKATKQLVTLQGVAKVRENRESKVVFYGMKQSDEAKEQRRKTDEEYPDLRKLDWDITGEN